jgi:predicted nucleic acid-binding Zn ribbon protein
MALKEHSMSSLKEIIARLYEDARLPFNPDDARIWGLWEETVGTAIAKNAHPSRIKDGRLTVLVSEAIWLQELVYLEGDIRQKINAAMGREAVSKIDFRLGVK